MYIDVHLSKCSCMFPVDMFNTSILDSRNVTVKDIKRWVGVHIY